MPINGSNFTDDISEMYQIQVESQFKVNIPETHQQNKLTAATKLLAARQQLKEVDEALAIKKEEYKIKMAGLELRKLAFLSKEQELERHLVKFDYYIKDNDIKKLRAEKKAQMEKTMQSAKMQELALQKVNLNYLMIRRDSLKEKLADQSAYARYLSSVVRKADEFNELRDVLTRHETLTHTLQELKQKEAETQVLIAMERQTLAKFLRSQNRVILELNRKLSDRQLVYDKQLDRAKRLDTKWNEIQNTSTAKTLELGAIRMGAFSMYHLILSQSRRMQALYAATSELKDPLDQLDMVQTYILDMTQIIDEVSRYTRSNSINSLLNVPEQ